MKRQCDTAQPVGRKGEEFRSGKPPSAGLMFIFDNPNGECRIVLLPVRLAALVFDKASNGECRLEE